MPDFKRTTMASRAYDKAHNAQYETKDLPKALGLYQQLLTAHPDTQEAEYSRTQMYNIVKSVVPKEDLLAAHVELTLARFKGEGAPEGELASIASTDDHTQEA